MYHPAFPEFQALAASGLCVPVYQEINADLVTPVSVYLKLRGARESFLLESVEGGEQLGRYSFLGVNPGQVISLRGNELTIRHRSRTVTVSVDGRDPLVALRELLAPFQVAAVSGLPRFIGGAVGYIGYDFVRHIERLPSATRGNHDLPDAILMLTDTLVAFDHVKHRALVVANARPDANPRAAYDDAIARIQGLVARLHDPMPAPSPIPLANGHHLESNMSPEQYGAMVEQAKDHIAAGDIFQVVLSQLFARETAAESFSVYRALRRVNPSPYMFFLDLGHTQLIGSSPEVLVRLDDRIAHLNLIAGTRPRGADPASDARLEQGLRDDPKERAEHVMLVDLGPNDLGRVCEYGTVSVPEYMTVERYSHVMHLVSHITGKLRAGLDAFDLLRATFPAGTLSGAPKVRAMEIIEEFEGKRRGPYAGAVGYITFPIDGKSNMDFCITIRTIIQRGRCALIQTGAGIVADSDPVCEHQECVNKARALAEAIRVAEQGLWER